MRLLSLFFVLLVFSSGCSQKNWNFTEVQKIKHNTFKVNGQPEVKIQFPYDVYFAQTNETIEQRRKTTESLLFNHDPFMSKHSIEMIEIVSQKKYHEIYNLYSVAIRRIDYENSRNFVPEPPRGRGSIVYNGKNNHGGVFVYIKSNNKNEIFIIGHIDDHSDEFYSIEIVVGQFMGKGISENSWLSNNSKKIKEFVDELYSISVNKSE